MKYRTIIIFSILLTGILVAAGCSSAGETTPSHTNILIDDSALGPPNTAQLFLSKIPKMGETFEISIQTKFRKGLFDDKIPTGIEHARASVEFFWSNIHGSYSDVLKAIPIPLSEVVADGQPAWEGDAQKGIKFPCTFKITREGIWNINWRIVSAETGKDFAIYPYKFEGIAVADGTSARLGSNELIDGPLAYLAKFPYGRTMENSIEYYLNDRGGNDVAMELDIAKAPLPGESVAVTCKIVSLHDQYDFTMNNEFMKREHNRKTFRMPGSELLTEGNLVRRCDLKAMVPEIISATIRFPEPGEWKIIVNGNYSGNRYVGYGSSLELEIGENRSSFGWED
jgi:hypothetical protein